jgi:hypothetical protein
MSKVSYNELAKAAIAALKDRTGSSLQAIKAYIGTNHPEVNLQAVSEYLFLAFFDNPFSFSISFVLPLRKVLKMVCLFK